MKIRNDFASAAIYLERLLLFGNVFHENNVTHWSHLKNREDFKKVYLLDDEFRYKFERVYSVGRDLAVYMSLQLDTFNDPAEHPTITSYIKSFDNSWLTQIEQLQEISQIAKEEKERLGYGCPWAVEQMIILFDKQVGLLQDVANTLNIIKTTDIYRVENTRQVTEEEPSRHLRVFLCHSSDDKPIVRELYNHLDSEGWIDAWLDEKKLYPGQDWSYEIEQAVKEADVILVCLTKNSVAKEGYVQRELRIILDFADYKPEDTIYIIPVRLEECEPPKQIQRWQYADYFPEDDRKNAYQHLLGSLKYRATRLGISTKLTPREISYETEEALNQSQLVTLMPDVEQKKEYRSHPSAPPRSAGVPGAKTSATPAALDARLTVLQGVGSTRATLLAKLGLYTLGDMLYYYPRRYLMEVEDLHIKRIVPIYSLTEGVTQKWLGNLMEQVVGYWAPAVVDALPESVLSSTRLMLLNEALLQVHLPTSQEKLIAARERLAFDEIFYLQMILLYQKREWKSVYEKRFGITDVKLIERARSEAQELFDKDAELSLPEHSMLGDALKRFLTDRKGNESYFEDSIFE